jgi:hypothetical protein
VPLQPLHLPQHGPVSQPQVQVHFGSSQQQAASAGVTMVMGTAPVGVTSCNIGVPGRRVQRGAGEPPALSRKFHTSLVTPATNVVLDYGSWQG